MISTELRQLLDHMEWADALVWKAAVDTPGAGDDARLRELLHHVHSVQCVYVQVLRDEPADIPKLDTFDDLPSVLVWGRACHAGLADLLPTLDEEALERTIDFPWAEQIMDRYGFVNPPDVRQALLQVASHSTYHRGQINTRIRELGGEPPLCDFVVWVWAGRPEPAWP